MIITKINKHGVFITVSLFDEFDKFDCLSINHILRNWTDNFSGESIQTKIINTTSVGTFLTEHELLLKDMQNERRII